MEKRMHYKMRIVIPSMGRADWNQQKTARALMEAGVPFVIIPPNEEEGCYMRLLPWRPPMSIVGASRVTTNMAELRDSVVHDMFPGEDVCMLDDNLKFYTAGPDNLCVRATSDDIERMLWQIDSALHAYACVTVGRHQGTSIHPHKSTGIFALRRDVAKEGFLFTPMETLELAHMQLQLLRAGKGVFTLPYDSVGGGERVIDPETQAREADRLAKLHPGIVKASTDGKRVRILWQRAAKGAA